MMSTSSSSTNRAGNSTVTAVTNATNAPSSSSISTSRSTTSQGSGSTASKSRLKIVSFRRRESSFYSRAFHCILFVHESDTVNAPTNDHLCPFLCLATAGFARTTYSFVLTNDSTTFCRRGPCSDGFHRYGALKITVPTTGNYTIRSNSSLDTFGYLYNNTFDTTYPLRNMLQYNDDDAGSSQFLLSMGLQTMNDYIVVATTFFPFQTGTYSVIVQGPAAASISVTNATGQCWQGTLDPEWMGLSDLCEQECVEDVFLYSSLLS